ncbi:hypothetical protein HDV00_001124 [Rhizophlyctis rosea]|nr:hypothetical protein HDV00_001124 [Rhizophlyctis rosea]
MSAASSLQRETALDAKNAPPQVEPEKIDELNIPENEDDICWYLAYGSNMTTKVLTGRRQVKPMEYVPVTVEGYRLAFDCRGFPYFEPAFASIRKIEPSDDKRVMHGVAFKITKRAYEHIRKTEGGGGHDNMGYLSITVDCQPYPSAAYPEPILKAQTLLYCDATPNLHPSLRYLNLLRDGAREHGLNPDYIAYLDAYPHYQSTTLRQKAGGVVFLGMFGWVYITYFSIAVGLGRMKIRMPKWSAQLLDGVSEFAWVVHNWVLAPVFGSGGRTIGVSDRKAVGSKKEE